MLRRALHRALNALVLLKLIGFAKQIDPVAQVGVCFAYPPRIAALRADEASGLETILLPPISALHLQHKQTAGNRPQQCSTCDKNGTMTPITSGCERSLRLVAHFFPHLRAQICRFIFAVSALSSADSAIFKKSATRLDRPLLAFWNFTQAHRPSAQKSPDPLKLLSYFRCAQLYAICVPCL